MDGPSSTGALKSILFSADTRTVRRQSRIRRSGFRGLGWSLHCPMRHGIARLERPIKSWLSVSVTNPCASLRVPESSSVCAHMTSVSSSTALSLEIPGRKGLGNRLASWHKKSAGQGTFDAHSLTISAISETSDLQSENSTVVKSHPRNPGMPEERTKQGIKVHTVGEKWAKTWMRKLRRKKKKQFNPAIIPEPRFKVLTLAEQLQLAQTEDFSLEECQVLLSQAGLRLYIDASYHRNSSKSLSRKDLL